MDITELEFDNLLKSDKGWKKETQGVEYVHIYQSLKNPDIVVKVFSSITRIGLGKKCGKDAIRVCGLESA